MPAKSGLEISIELSRPVSAKSAVGGVVHHFTPGIAEQKFHPAAGVPQARLERVVVGVPHRRKITVTPDAVGEIPSSAVDNTAGNGVIDAIFPVRTTGGGTGHDLAVLAHTQAEGRVTGICLQIGKQPMPLCAHVGQAEESIRPELPLNRKAIMFRIGKSVSVEKPGGTDDGG